MFEGIKIVELAQWVFVPAAGAVFSNLGAEVVKIERLGGGDPLRALFTASLGQQSGAYNPRVEQNNSGKKSLAIDIGSGLNSSFLRPAATESPDVGARWPLNTQ